MTVFTLTQRVGNDFIQVSTKALMHGNIMCAETLTSDFLCFFHLEH